MWSRLRQRPNLKIEITLILVFKALAIYSIWALFFSHPLDKRLTPTTMSAHLLSTKPG